MPLAGGVRSSAIPVAPLVSTPVGWFHPATSISLRATVTSLSYISQHCNVVERPKGPKTGRQLLGHIGTLYIARFAGMGR